ncbi:tRNA epoxyqueuosine(34) reductase QueG [uncultured Cytophaga sp.]|uniref:tRNA epoxyqueuosine(34) reductase QueG n=1 Tax=uncultured Cytophaga sp. TaxID=160238 RepID=UPI00261428C9|nr:tRNA epoxyqueuosine(34) reductase QueG [uncultured Cytophaga sp.]
MASLQIAHNTRIVKEAAKLVGFDYCGISKADFLEKEAPRLESWLNRNQHGTMAWIENYFDKRLDPRKLVDGAKSVVSVLLNYTPNPEDTILSEGDNKLSRYAYGEDYHYVVKDKFKLMMQYITEHIGEVSGRAFVDSAPVMDKAWAEKSGLGWVGKHTLLITKDSGSYFFIGELILDLELDTDGPIKDYCGTCTRCIDACPTDAITEPYQVNASKCISYLTIELKEQIPTEFKDQMKGWAFGCDICQEVCPWNRFATPNKTKEFSPSEELKKYFEMPLKEITKDVFNELFKGSPLKRTKIEGLSRNLAFLKKDY